MRTWKENDPDREPKFLTWCAERDVKPTKRQHAKWLRVHEEEEIETRRQAFRALRKAQERRERAETVFGKNLLRD